MLQLASSSKGNYDIHTKRSSQANDTIKRGVLDMFGAFQPLVMCSAMYAVEAQEMNDRLRDSLGPG